jgi:ssRNA-specific RNase YbeY (16S rRNA maturation enzyme)
VTAKRLAVVVRNAAPTGAPPPASIRKWATAALRGSRGEVTVRIVGEAESAQLNSRYRKLGGATNVLSFPAGASMPLR